MDIVGVTGGRLEMSDSAKGWKNGRLLLWSALPVAVVLAGLAVTVALLRSGRLEKAFDGDSTGLKATVIVPTLDTPLPEGKNAIWCASFQIAWNHLRHDVIKEPIRIRNAEVVAGRLNRAKQSEADLPPDSYYAAAGFVKDGILETIRKEMAARFPDVEPHQFDPLVDVIVAYAYLAANVRFTIPFFENRPGFTFTDSSGKKTAVSSFGVRGKDMYGCRKLRQQIEILYTNFDYENRRRGALEFAVDPCKDSSPNQVALTCIPRKSTLGETLDYVGDKISEFRGDRNQLSEFGMSQRLLVPNILFRIDHHLKELEGLDKIVLNAIGRGLFVREAFQSVFFKLDRSGAELESEAAIALACTSPPDLLFDRPFLVYMRKRGAEHPFFVMWVDNAELLCKR